MSEETKQENVAATLDLSGLADFQFGPKWARNGEKKEKSFQSREFSQRGDQSRSDRRGKFTPRRDSHFSKDSREGNRGDRRDGERRFDRNRGRYERDASAYQPVEPTPGLRVELRPVDACLALCVAEVKKHKQVVSLYEFAKVLVAAHNRYDLVFMRQQDGPELIASKKGDFACWLTKDESVSYLWSAPWFSDYYEAIEQEAEAPKGNFQAIAKCSMNNEWIGPVNWHGYQSALVNLHRNKFSNMSFDHFRTKVVTEKSEEAVAAWLESVSKKIVWKSKREGVEDVLETPALVEKDFVEHHYHDVYECQEKVFINGDVSKRALSAGLWAHFVKLVGVTKKHPTMLIPNICHGLARHHMPIFKWNGGHHTGPNRPKLLPADMVLATSMTNIMTWVKEHEGQRVNVMLKDLSNERSSVVSVDSGALVEEDVPVQALTEEEEGAVDTVAVDTEEGMPPTVAMEMPQTTTSVVEDGASQQHQAIVRDLFWLCDQGYVLVFSNGKIFLPKSTSEGSESPKGTLHKKKARTSKTPSPAKAELPKEKVSSEESEHVTDVPESTTSEATSTPSSNMAVDQEVAGVE